MDSYGLTRMGDNEALDFTAAAMKNSTDKNVEPPVLDLSCKKSDSQQLQENSPSYALSPISCEDLSNSPTMINPKQENCRRTNVIADYSDDERKSPFEGRNFMVTPPSETDSPRKQKYENVYDRQLIGNDSIAMSDSMNNRRSMIPINLPSGIVVPTGLSNLLTTPNNNNNNNEQTMMQIAVSTSSSTSPISHEVASPMTSPETCKKAPRPFKAYPKDPLSLTLGTPEMMYDPNSNEAYSEFRKRMLDSVRRTNEGTNIKMRRVTKSPGLPTSTMDDKDAAYWERRRKNNEAAKRSRDARRAKEDEIAIRAAFLEQENMKLKYELAALRNETAKLRCMVYTN